jgi:predicted transcriptional regulator
MSRAAFTLRIDSQERNALKHLSKIEGRPINQLLNEAIKIFLRQKGRKERSLEASLENLEAYRKKDPGYKRAITALVDAEATVRDPLEGEPFEETDVENSVKSVGPVRSRVREVLGA